MIALLVLCVLCLHFPRASSTPKSGIYVDNGYDQTAIERLLDTDEKQAMELEVLNLLGLPHRPRSIEKSPLRKAAPRYLLDIYRNLAEHEGDDEDGPRLKRSADVYFSGEEQQQIDESDVIMTFESMDHQVDSVRHERGKRLWFNVTEVPILDDIVGAELRMFKEEGKSSSKHPNAKFTITVYQLIRTDDGERELEFVSALNTTSEFSGWLTMNVTGCLTNWVTFPSSNKGIYLSVHLVDKPGHELRPEDVGLVTTKADDEVQPFMVAFLKADNQLKPRVTREVRSRRDTYTNLLGDYRRIKREEGKLEQRNCHIETLYVNFKDLNWQDWILAPVGYAAFYCKGECNFPLNSYMNATNHAIVQTLLQLLNPSRYPKACCVPNKLSHISFLRYSDDRANVLLQKYKKMVVRSCGCH